MNLRSIILSQSIRFGSPSGHPKGIFLPDLMGRLKEEFRFVETPTNAEQYNVEDGVSLKYGSYDGYLINTFKIYRTGMFLEGVAGTEVMDAMLDKIEDILRSNFSTAITPAAPVSKIYFSRIEVMASDAAQRGLNELQSVRDKMTRMVRAYGIDVDEYQVGGFALLADPQKSTTDAKPQRFLFERRSSHPFEQNVFFSEAPLQTSEHLDLLNELEASLISG